MWPTTRIASSACGKAGHAMKITRIEMFGMKLTYAHGEYVMSKGRKSTFHDSTLVRIETADGQEGWGETVTLGRDTADCAIVRRMTSLPLILDESVVNASELCRAKLEAGASAVNIKLGRVGGISAAVRMRDLAQDLQISYCIEDMFGGDIVSAAVSHVASSSSPEHLLHCSFFNDWSNEHVAGYQPRSRNGRGSAPTGPGLGIEVDRTALDAPLAVFQ